LDRFPLWWPALQWKPAADYAIDMGNDDTGIDRWNAGHVNAVIANGASAVIGTETGGVWLVNPAHSSFPAKPVSWDWSNPNIDALAFGPSDPTTVFAGCTSVPNGDTSLYLIKLRTDTNGLELVQTMPLRLSPSVSVQGIVTMADPDRIVLATDKGVLWSAIPPDPTQSAAYNWQAASNVKASGIALGLNDTVVVAAYGNGVPNDPGSGLFVGQWSPAGLSLTPGVLPAGLPGLTRTSVASCENDRSVLYASAAGPDDNTPGAVLRSGDGGYHWSQCGLPTTSGHNGQYNNCVAVHPNDSGIVACEFGGGPFISITSGQTWEVRLGDQVSMHADVHALTFEEMGDGTVGLYAGSDGGVCLSLDLGEHWDSRYNKHLRNLEFTSTQHYLSTDVLDNKPFDVSPDVLGLYGGATQDNGNLWCLTGNDNARASFHQFESGDGNTVIFVTEADSVLHVTGGVPNGDRLRVSRWQDSTLSMDDEFGDVVPAAGFTNGMPFPQVVSAVQYASASINGNLIRVVAGQGTTVYGYVDGGHDGSFVAIADVGRGSAANPRAIRSIASVDGSQILVGTSDGNIYTVDTATRAVAENAMNLDGFNGSPITQLIWTGDDDRFGIVSANTVIRWANSAWEPAPGAVGADVFCIDFEGVTTGGALFACTDFGVSVSTDRGDSWIPINDGLPAYPHCVSVRVGYDAQGQLSLFLSTYGWSTFVATLPPRPLGQVVPPVPTEVARIVAGIIDDGDGIEIIGETIIRVPPREPARDLAVAVVIAALVEQLSEEHLERGREFLNGFETTFGGSERG